MRRKLARERRASFAEQPQVPRRFALFDLEGKSDVFKVFFNEEKRRRKRKVNVASFEGLLNSTAREKKKAKLVFPLNLLKNSHY